MLVDFSKINFEQRQSKFSIKPDYFEVRFKAEMEVSPLWISADDFDVWRKVVKDNIGRWRINFIISDIIHEIIADKRGEMYERRI